MKVRLTDGASSLKGAIDRHRACAGWDPSFFITQKKYGMERESRRRGGSSRRMQGRDRSARERCREPDTKTAFPGTFVSLDLDRSREKDAMASFSGENSAMAVVEATNTSTCRRK